MSRLTELEFKANKEGDTQLLCGVVDCPGSSARCWISCTVCCIETDEKFLKLCQDLSEYLTSRTP